jgi:hypothetical protein
MPESPDLLLYHYTSLAGFKGIVESKKLWATTVHYLNDAREFLEAYMVMEAEILKRLSAKPPAHHKAFLDQFLRDRRVLMDMNLCVFSLAVHGDLLSQWRGYCPSGRGYSLGFDRQGLSELAERHQFRLERCIYNRREQEDAVSQILDAALDTIEGVDAESITPAATLPLQSDFLRLAPRIKNTAFAEEDEWRLISVSQWDDVQMQFREGARMLIPHYAIPANPLPLREVIVGPTPDLRHAVESAQHFLRKERIFCDVRPSKVPYRTH